MKMETICFAITLMMTFSTQIVTLSAQGSNTSACEYNIQGQCGSSGERSYLEPCCTELKFTETDDRDCYCQSTGKFQAKYLTNCGIADTIDSICSGKKSKMKIIIAVAVVVVVLVCSIIGVIIFIRKKSKIKIIIAVAIVVVVLVCSVIGVIIFIRKRKSKLIAIKARDVKDDVEKGPSSLANNSQEGTKKDGLVTPESLQYELEDLQLATNNFSRDNKIGRGGFGIVYKGTLPNGQQIAVKRLSNGSGQGDKEFQTEVALLAKLQHRNLVKLLGYCLVDDEALLVYEFLENKSLDYFLYDNNKRAELNWSRRFEIIKGVARGMMYIHDDCPVRMMHRDLKAANVLLDAEMYPKIADFGLARICDVGQTHINPTRVVGTHGYMAPEYIYHGQFSAKSDVYALGVLILEVVSGRRISDSSFKQQGRESLLSHAWRCWEDEKPLEIMDPTLKDSYSSDEVLKCVQLGLLCVQEDSSLRPTMSTVVHMFNSYSGVASLPAPQHPAFIYSGGSNQPLTSSSKGDTTGSMA